MIKHPAKYTDKFIPIFAEKLKNCENVLDPFAGVGKLAAIKDHGYRGKVYCNELEKEWMTSCLYNVDYWNIGDAENLPYNSNIFDAICTSPTYGNRMADHHKAKDSSKRITYTHCLGRDLTDGNTGKMQWGADYREKHKKIYFECKRVLKNDGLFIVNISNHIRKGEIVDVVGWHKNCLVEAGLLFIEEIKIDTNRMGFGANAKLRVETESILIFKKV